MKEIKTLERLLEDKFMCEEEYSLYNLYLDFIKIRGNSVCIYLDKALDFIDDTIKHNFSIHGMDIFRLEENTTEPLDIADYSYPINETWIEYQDLRYKSALNFIKQIRTQYNTSIYVEFGLISYKNWTSEYGESEIKK